MPDPSVEAPVILIREAGFVTLQINRPESRNALSDDVRLALIETIASCDADPEVGCIVIAGNEKVFAAGADIKALRDRTIQEELQRPGTANLFEVVAACKTPTIAAVAGYALGGGFELALACDMIVAASSAEFGVPEITLGIIPGGGGTQRLARVIGKQRAMELVLTGRRISADEAHQMGLVNSVVRDKDWLVEAHSLAAVVARRPRLAARLGKQAVLAADEMPLGAGLSHERRLFDLTLATEDRVEGMTAFIEKRKPKFSGR